MQNRGWQCAPQSTFNNRDFKQEAILHTYGSSNGPDCSLIKKGGGAGSEKPMLTLAAELK